MARDDVRYVTSIERCVLKMKLGDDISEGFGGVAQQDAGGGDNSGAAEGVGGQRGHLDGVKGHDQPKERQSLERRGRLPNQLSDALKGGAMRDLTTETRCRGMVDNLRDLMTGGGLNRDRLLPWFRSLWRERSH